MLDKDVRRYPDEVETNCKSYGFKAANLLYLEKQTENIRRKLEERNLDIKVVVPDNAPNSYQSIEAHLDKYEGNGWRQLCEEFKNAFESQSDQKTIDPNTLEILKNLQERVIKCFEAHPYSSAELKELLTHANASTLFMVRSTGLNEDKVDMANPGGNLSMVSTVETMPKAMSMVSVVSEKSILQRLKSGDQNITDLLIMPVVVQTLIGEGLEQTSSKSRQKFVSGVIYTNNDALRIQSAPGHGEYVVNSKGPTDNYYISKEGIIYSEIRPKEHRLLSKINPATNEILLTWMSNETNDAYSSSLPNEALRAIQIAAHEIEAAYKMRMDIEFVYDVQNKTLNIVQARSIPLGNRKNLEPSAVSARYLANPIHTLNTINGLHVITPEVNKSAVVTDPAQVIVCKDIKDALEEFLKPGNVRRDIRAVIVENYAPDTSHEAGQFNLNALPVMQVADITALENILKEPDPLIIVDPQRSKIYQMNPSLKNKQKDVLAVEAELYQTQLIEKGIFSSSLSAYVSPREYDFSQGTIQSTPIEQAMKLFKEDNRNLGDLVNKAEVGDVDAQNLLFSVAYEAMNYPVTSITQDLKYNFQQLEAIKMGEKNDTCKVALAKILKSISNFRKKGLITSKVYKQSVIAGSNLAILLNSMEDEKFNLQDKKIQDEVILEYFNVKRKFEGSVIGISNNKVLVQSVMTDLMDEERKKLIGKIAFKEKIDLKDFGEEQKTILHEVSKLGSAKAHSIYNENWLKFCLEVCKSKEGANQLAAIVANLVKLDIHENWLNVFFAKAYKIHDGNSAKILDSLKNDFSKFDFKSMKESQRLLSEIDAQVPQFADKSKFDNLYQDLQNKLNLLMNLLSYRDNLSNLEKSIIMQNTKKFIEVMDRTIKALDYSLEYQDEDNQLRAHRLRKLIKTFSNCMDPWLPIAYPHEIKQISELQRDLNQAIQNSTAYDKNRISKSSEFDVRAAIIMDTMMDRTNKSANLKNCKSLEDCFSCIHQNFIAAIDQVEMQQNLIMGREFYPPILAQFEEALMGLKAKKFGTTQTRISNPENHLNELPPHIIYKIPLSIHNAMATVFKSSRNDQWFLKYITGSPFSEEPSRWSIISVKSDFDLIFSGIALLSPRGFKHEPDYQYSSRFCVCLTADKVPFLLQTIEQSIAGTYQVFYAKHSAEDEKRFLLLEKIEDNTLKSHHKIALNLITQGYFSRNYFFNNNTANRIKILHKLIQFTEPDEIFSLYEISEEEKKQKYRFDTIKKLLNDSDLTGIELFFSQLYTNPDFDEAFCRDLTSFGKIEFTKRYLDTANKPIKEKLDKNPYIIALLKSNQSILKDSRETLKFSQEKEHKEKAAKTENIKDVSLKKKKKM